MRHSKLIVSSVLAASLTAACSRQASQAEATAASTPATAAGGATYTPPTEGASLVQSVTATRDANGRAVIRGKLLLPEATRVWVELFPVKAVAQDAPLGHAELYLNPGGTFEAGPFAIQGDGPFRVQITSYFSRAWQPTDVLRAVGTKGTKLPKSALKLDNPGTPGAGGHFEYSTTVTIGS